MFCDEYVSTTPDRHTSHDIYIQMSKMGKNGTHAMGFAIYFDALDRILHTKEKNSPDAYIIYDSLSSPDTLVSLTERLAKNNISYSALNSLPDSAKNATVYTVSGNEVKEEKI